MAGMMDAIRELLGSKKFLMAVLGMVAAGLARWGVNLNVEETMAWLSPLLAAIVGQGIADHGKTAAQITTSAVAAVASPPARDGERGSVVGDTLIALATVGLVVGFVIGVGSLSGCSWLKGEARKTADALVDCTKAESARAVHELGPVVDVVLAQAIQPDGKVEWAPLNDLAKGTTVDVFGCVLADVVAREMRSPASGGPKSSPLVADPASLRDGFRALAFDKWGHATFRTAHGDI